MSLFGVFLLLIRNLYFTFENPRPETIERQREIDVKWWKNVMDERLNNIGATTLHARSTTKGIHGAREIIR